jgi:hypothetical protein
MSSGWWHSGETRGSSIYRQSRPILFMIPLSVIILACVFRFKLPQVFAFFFTVSTIDCILTARRALILTETTLIFRQALGSNISVPLSVIVSVEEIQAVSGTLLIPQRVARAVRITTNGEASAVPFVFPLTVTDADGLIRRLYEIAAHNAPS